jgi:hypothetical protein
MERGGPPRIVTEALPFTWKDGLAVLWSTTNGTGVITALKPQLAEAFTFTVFMEEAILVKYVATGSVTVTLM